MASSVKGKWLDKFNKLSALKVAGIIAVVGLSIFFTGLNNPFQEDDTYQIVNNPVVHSISNFVQFFQASTFYNGEKLSGVYYRPLMTTVFALIYTLFGPHPIAFHLVQLTLYLSGAFLLYLVFRHFFKTILALPLALIFLVHPLNSQVVYSIPTMQDALYFFFGILAIWLLITYKSTKSLWYVAASLLLAMLSKESGIVFPVIAFLYLFWFDRQRLRNYSGIMALPIILYLAMKISAVGISHAQHAAPIDNISLLGRLFTAPSIILFYLTKFIFPWKLSSGYYWVYPKFSVIHVLVPLLIDLAVISVFAYLGLRIRNMLSRSELHLYLFFAAWVAIGMSLYLQIIPLDMTACETWSYFSMAGLLGMIGTALLTVKLRIKPQLPLLLVALMISILGLRSAVRGTDYRSQYVLAQHDIVASDGNYAAMNNLSQALIQGRKYKEAAVYAQRSIDIYPVISNYNDLGVALEQTGDYSGAEQAYRKALGYNNLNVIYENLSLILVVYSDPSSTDQLFQKALNIYPHDFKLWLYLAIYEGTQGNTAKAKEAIQTAAMYGSIPPYIYDHIMNDQQFELPLLGKTLLVKS